ncbi:MAG: tryptophan-rich sensory protein [Proteobacteria bacterium]|nr:tryptophan-rich sensory protein [Pseudomonadota bacterium]
MLILLRSFALNGLLHSGWSPTFFKWRRPDQAFLVNIVLWLSTVLLVVVCYAALSLAGWLIAPYVAWVTLAACLNRAVVRLNLPAVHIAGIASRDAVDSAGSKDCVAR